MPPPSSLVLTRELDTRCPRSDWDRLNVLTGERHPLNCRVWSCTFCGPRKASNYAHLAAASRPERLVTLTGVRTFDWQTVRRRMHHLKQAVKRLGRTTEWWWAVEENPRHTGWHIHALQHGDYIPQYWLQQQWGARVDLRTVSRERAGARYVVKGAARRSSEYVTKGTAPEGISGHLARNGNRAAHWSKRYHRMDDDTRYSATDLAHELHSLTDPQWWMAVPRDGLTAEILGRIDLAEYREKLTASCTEQGRNDVPPVRPRAVHFPGTVANHGGYTGTARAAREARR